MYSDHYYSDWRNKPIWTSNFNLDILNHWEKGELLIEENVNEGIHACNCQVPLVKWLVRRFRTSRNRPLQKDRQLASMFPTWNYILDTSNWAVWRTFFINSPFINIHFQYLLKSWLRQFGHSDTVPHPPLVRAEGRHPLHSEVTQLHNSGNTRAKNKP